MTTGSRRNVRCYLCMPSSLHNDDEGSDHLIVSRDKRQVTVDSALEKDKPRFSFDRIFDGHDSQNLVYKEAVSPLVADFMSGRNCAVLAYGDAKLGSFTILGPPSSQYKGMTKDSAHDDDGSAVSSLSGGGVSTVVKPTTGPLYNNTARFSSSDPPAQVVAAKRAAHASFVSGSYSKLDKTSPVIDERGQAMSNTTGVVYLAAKQVVELLHRKRQSGDKTENPILRFAMAEVCGEVVIDLLNDHACDMESLQNIVDRNTKDYGEDGDLLRVEDNVCDSVEDILSFLEKGLSRRQSCLDSFGKGPTESHLIVIFKLERYSKSRGKRVISYFFFGVLADSELIHKAHSREASELQVREAKLIKKSLGALRKCLRAVSTKNRSSEIPWHESALTKLMRDALVRGAGIAVMIASHNVKAKLDTTMSAMRFGGYVSGQTRDDKSLVSNGGEKRESPTSSSTGRRHNSAASPHRERDQQSGAKGKTGAEQTVREESLLKQIEELQNQNQDLRKVCEAKDRELNKASLDIKALQQVNDKTRSRFDDRATTGTTGTSTTAGMDESIGTMNTVLHNNDPLCLSKGPEKRLFFDDIDVGPSPICVCLRLRPLTKLETSRRSRSCIEVHEGSSEFTIDSPLDGEYDFCFDTVFDIEASQEDVYRSVGAPIVTDVLSGINNSLAVYGLSGTGKAYTMIGPSASELEGGDMAAIGIAPRMISELFSQMSLAPSNVEFSVTCSFVAIFLEKMYDLLEPQHNRTLLVKNTPCGVEVEGASKAFCFNANDALSLLQRGSACRSVIGSKLDIDAMQSHSIFMLNVEQRHVESGETRRSYLHFCQLACFEVASKAKVGGAQEAKLQNRSFASLGGVVKSLTNKETCRSYDQSKLTSIMKDAFGGNCKTTFLITASPSSYHISDTINVIRLGQRIRKVINSPHTTRELSSEGYRAELRIVQDKCSRLLQSFKALEKEVCDNQDLTVKQLLRGSIWQSIKSLVQNQALTGGWSDATATYINQADSEKIASARTESLLADIQSEVVVLRRLNEVLVRDKRQQDAELTKVLRTNKLLEVNNSELENKLGLAVSRARESVEFLRFMRLLCWRLRKDIWRGRPISVSEITEGLSGAPDLSGLVDLDRMMVDAGFIVSPDMSLEDVEDEFFGYLLETGLIIDESIATEEMIFDDLSGLEDDIRTERQRGEVGLTSRWQGTRPPQQPRLPEYSSSSQKTDPQTQTTVGSFVPWLRASIGADGPRTVPEQEHDRTGTRYTSREWELQCDLRNMSDKCVELQLLHNEQTQLVESLTNKSGSLQKKRLAQEAVALRKERDRMIHNAKAAMWKLQELHVVNKLLAKQVEESKQQVTFLEEGFQNLQESLRSTVHESLESESQLRERLAVLQTIVDSLTGPVVDETVRSRNVGNEKSRIFLPIRGKMQDKSSTVTASIDLTSFKSKAQCLVQRPRQKTRRRIPAAGVVRCHTKYTRRSRKTGTALAGAQRADLVRASRVGSQLLPPRYFSTEDNDVWSFY